MHVQLHGYVNNKPIIMNHTNNDHDNNDNNNNNLISSRLDFFPLGDTLRFEDHTPLGGMALAPHPKADLPYPRNPPY
jgi:hypothetical protein